MDDIDLLAGSELFSAFDEASLQTVVARARPARCERNFVVFEEGSEADELFVVRSGRVAVGRRSVDGRESLVALDGGRRPVRRDAAVRRGNSLGVGAGARALGGARHPLRRGPRRARRAPQLLWEVVRLLADRLRNTDSALADAVFLDVTGRTAKRLLELAGGEDDFHLPITQEELAGLVGASRERVNKSIAAFVRLGGSSSSTVATASSNASGSNSGPGIGTAAAPADPQAQPGPAATQSVIRTGSVVAVEDAGLGQAGQSVLDGRAVAASMPSTVSRSSIVARIIFCRLP